MPSRTRTGTGKGKQPMRASVAVLVPGQYRAAKGSGYFCRSAGLAPERTAAGRAVSNRGTYSRPRFLAKGGRRGARTLQNFSVKGALSHVEAIELMREADVVVSASRDEAMPTVTILEAMSLGKALIATIVGGALEVLVDGENALLVKPEAPDALAGAIRRLIENPTLVRRAGKKGAPDLRKRISRWSASARNSARSSRSDFAAARGWASARCLNWRRTRNGRAAAGSLCLARDDLKWRADPTGPSRPLVEKRGMGQWRWLRPMMGRSLRCLRWTASRRDGADPA